jgi:hypothetical protein
MRRKKQAPGRSSGSAADQIRIGHQPEGSESARSHGFPSLIARANEVIE